MGLQLHPGVLVRNQLLDNLDPALDHLADGPQPELVPGYVAWVLVHLVGYGLAATIPASPAPPIRKLNWTAVYPAAAEAA
jgi:hypothetical protein